MNASTSDILVRTDERSLYEAKGDVMYWIRYMALQQRFYQRMAGLFSFLSLFGGSAAFIGFLTSSPLVTGISGLVVSASTVLDFVVSPGKKSIQCFDSKKQFQKALRKSDAIGLDSLDGRVSKITMLDTPHIESLRRPAYNDSVIERGRGDFTLPLSRWEKLVKAIA
ncbi:hypothetical protein ACUN9Y_07790 [Halomonas sp. V046]|uniref:hypothetical protein n=1 Tax=Halomonas sp. V046 TaxID=3459611 RepID=UPI0040442791